MTGADRAKGLTGSRGCQGQGVDRVKGLSGPRGSTSGL